MYNNNFEYGVDEAGKKRMTSGYTISKGCALALLALWILITVAIALMVAYIPDHSCSDPDTDPTTTTTPEVSTEPATEFPPQGDGPWMDPFLNEEIRPTHYVLYLDPDFYYNGTTYKGRENITIEVGVETEHLIVHYKMMNITQTRVWDEDERELDIAEVFSYDTHEYWITSLASPVSAGSVVVLHLEFEGSLVNGIVGYYKSTYTNMITNEESWMSTTKFQPTDARKAFPNFDEPQYKANFTVTQRHWHNFTALSNMPERSFTSLDETWRETEFETSVKMSSYLVCFIVFDFAYKENNVSGGKPHRIWATPDKIELVDYALSLTDDLVAYFEEEFDMAYHLPKLDQVAVPDYPSGATEHWGLITYRENRLLYDETISGASDKQAVAEIVAHELAHNLFGNIITCRWWDDTWLNEGFATYLSHHTLDTLMPDKQQWFGNAVTCLWWNDIWLNEGFAVYYDSSQSLNDIEPEFESEDHFVVSTMQGMMADDAEASSRAITANVTHPDEINQAFSGPVYSKGASILRMMDHFLGDNNFRDGIRTFLAENEYGSVTTDDLWAVIQQQMGDGYGMAAMMDPWVEQMGLPVVNVSSPEPGKLRLQQSRFLNDPDADPLEPWSKHGYKWFIPLTYITQSSPGTETFVWLNKTDMTEIADPRGAGEWIKFNYKQYGYYRVNYDTEMWADLSQQLIDSHETFTEVDRSNIMDDAFNLARATQLSYSTALDMTVYLEVETHYFPWSSVGYGLSYISSMLYSDEYFSQWRAYMQEISTPMMNRLGIEDQPGDTHLDKLNREYIIVPLSCGHGYEQCLFNVTELFLAWLQNDSFPLSPNLRRTVYRYGMQQTGGDDAWETVWQRYQAASGTEVDNLAYCLAQTNRQWLIRRYLEYAMDPEIIRTQDFFTVIAYLSYNRYANRHVWDWTRANYDALVDRFGTSDRYFGQMVPKMVAGYNTQFQLMEVEEFYAKYPDAGAGAGPRAASIASIEANIAWMDRNRDDIIKWLSDNQDVYMH